MGDTFMGPGQPCSRCGLTYGQHEDNCPVNIQDRRERTNADTKLGVELLEAIDNRDAEKIGRLLRTHKGKK